MARASRSGTGTVLDPRGVESLVAAGATFLVAPNVDPAVCREADRLGVLHIPGALTPTEVRWRCSSVRRS